MFSPSVRFLTHTSAKAAQILQIFNETHNKLSPCRFSALLSASVRARAAYREAVCGRGGASRRLPFVHLRSADARVRAVGLGGVSVSGGRYGMEKAAGSNPDPNNKNKTHNPYGLHGLAYIKKTALSREQTFK